MNKLRARMKGYPPWPAKVVIKPKSLKRPGKLKEEAYPVFFFGTYNYAFITEDQIWNFSNNFDKFSKVKKPPADFQAAIDEAMSLKKQYGEDFLPMQHWRAADMEYSEVDLAAAMAAEPRGRTWSDPPTPKDVDSDAPTPAGSAVGTLCDAAAAFEPHPLDVVAQIDSLPELESLADQYLPALTESVPVKDSDHCAQVSTFKKVHLVRGEAARTGCDTLRPHQLACAPDSCVRVQPALPLDGASPLDRAAALKQMLLLARLRTRQPHLAQRPKPFAAPTAKRSRPPPPELDDASTGDEPDLPSAPKKDRASFTKLKNKPADSAESSPQSSGFKIRKSFHDLSSTSFSSPMRGKELLGDGPRSGRMSTAGKSGAGSGDGGVGEKPERGSGGGRGRRAARDSAPPAAGGKAAAPKVNLARSRGTDFIPTPSKIGFIGLGRMGATLAANLVRTGHELIVWSPDPLQTDAFVADHPAAAEAKSLVQLVRDAELIISCSADTDVIYGSVPASKQGVVDVLNECRRQSRAASAPVADSNKGFVLMSAIGPDLSEQIEQAVEAAGGRYLEVQICGGTYQLARDGLLTLLAAGDFSLFQDITTCLQSVSQETLFIGNEVGNACRLRLTAALLQANVTAAIAESVVLAEKLNLDTGHLARIIANGDLNCAAINGIVQSMRSGSTSTTGGGHRMALKLMGKDLINALRLSHDVPMPMHVSSATNELFKRALALDKGDEDCSAIYWAVMNI